MAGSELNRTRGKRGGKRAKIGVGAISSPSLPSLSSFFFRRQYFSRALLSERLEQASTVETTLSRTARQLLFVKEWRQNQLSYVLTEALSVMVFVKTMVFGKSSPVLFEHSFKG